MIVSNKKMFYFAGVQDEKLTRRNCKVPSENN